MSLAKLLTRQKSLVDLLKQVATVLPDSWWVEDQSAQLLFGTDTQTTAVNAFPVIYYDEVSGWVKGSGDSVPLVANLLGNWMRLEQEKKQLATETLHLYREINLIFTFSEKLSKVIGSEAIARLALEEAKQMISFTQGAVLLWHEKQQQYTIQATLGEMFFKLEDTVFGEGIIQSGRSEIITDPTDASSMILYASLKLGAQVLGCIALRGAFFAASELKLLTTLAVPTAASLESVVRHEQHIASVLKAQREQLMLDLALKNTFFKKLMAVVEAHHSDPAFSPAKLAQSQHLSPSQLQRRIAALTDLTAVQIIRYRRLAHARELLKDTSRSISEIAFESGFQDSSYFTRLFAREMGCTPSEWRSVEVQDK